MTVRRPDAALLALVAAALLATLAALDPRLRQPGYGVDLLIIVDITQSMNTRDGLVEGQPASRLDQVKADLPRLIAALPCGSRVGLGVFTERRSVSFIDPVETCANYTPLAGSISALDWRMAWEGDSQISRGLHKALDRARALDADLLFLTDGHEAPPLPFEGGPPYRGETGKVGGLVVGVGGPVPAPIPRHDDLGFDAGFFGPGDVQQFPARIGTPPPDAASRPGYNPRNNPYGDPEPGGAEHLSSLRSDYLSGLADGLGLGYADLSGGIDSVLAAVGQHARRRPIPASFSLAPTLGGGALLAIALACLLTGLGERRPAEARGMGAEGTPRRRSGRSGADGRTAG